MEEQRISIKTAILYRDKGLHDKRVNGLQTCNNEGCGIMITQSLLQKLLREYHKIEVFVSPDNVDWTWPLDNDDVSTTCEGYRVNYGYIDGKPHNYDGFELEICGFKTYEEALEEGLYNALKLIK